MRKTCRKILRAKVVTERTGYSRIQIWRKSRDPEDDFPAPMQLGPNAIGWYEHEIDAWLESRPRVTSAADAIPEPEAALVSERQEGAQNGFHSPQ